MRLPYHKLGGKIAPKIGVTAPEQTQRDHHCCDADPEQERLKRVIGKRQPRCCHIHRWNNEIAHEGQCQKHDLVDFIMLGNRFVAESQPRIAKANGSPKNQKHSPNELASKCRHSLTPNEIPRNLLDCTEASPLSRFIDVRGTSKTRAWI